MSRPTRPRRLGPEERIVGTFRTSSIKPQMDLFWQGCVRLADAGNFGLS